MATNTGKGFRRGAVDNRSQMHLPNGHWAKRDADTGRIMEVKSDTEPFKGVRKEHSDQK